MPNTRGATDIANWITEEWIAKLAGSVELMTEVRPDLKLGSRVPANAPEIPAETSWYAIPLNLGTDAVIFVGAPEKTCFHVGKSALEAAGVTDVSVNDARSTYLEIITQATSSLAQGIAGRLGKSVASLPAKVIKPGEDSFVNTIEVTPVEISLREPTLGKLYIGWSQALHSALSQVESSEHEQAADAAVDAPTANPLQGKPRTLDLLMEVELPVSVSFGRAQLPLRDVLKLNSGSIVELNRTISDPVEIIANNCVIARGEVVVVEGNYGVRIHQVISREERLRTLK